MAWFVPFLIGLAISIVSYLILPKPKLPKPEAAKDADDPVAEAGKPLPVLSGTVTMKGLNILWFGEKATVSRTMRSQGGKK